MWTRKELKEKGKANFKKNYWMAVAICFVLAIVSNEYATSVSAIDQYDKNRVQQDVNIAQSSQPASNWDLASDFWAKIHKSEEAIFKNENIEKAVKEVFDSSTQAQSYLFKILSSAQEFFIHHQYLAGLISLLAAIGSLAFILLLSYPFIVGARRFFLENRVHPDTKVGTIVFAYKREHYLNIVKVMFLKGFFYTLWCFTIVGLFPKLYQYRMIPYIVAENPNIHYKEAFQLTKKITKGNKWKMFVLDLSFIGWNFLTAVTFGLVGIFYYNGYHAATMAELYTTLKENAYAA